MNKLYTSLPPLSPEQGLKNYICLLRVNLCLTLKKTLKRCFGIVDFEIYPLKQETDTCLIQKVSSLNNKLPGKSTNSHAYLDIRR